LKFWKLTTVKFNSLINNMARTKQVAEKVKKVQVKRVHDKNVEKYTVDVLKNMSREELDHAIIQVSGYNDWTKKHLLVHLMEVKKTIKFLETRKDLEKFDLQDLRDFTTEIIYNQYEDNYLRDAILLEQKAIENGCYDDNEINYDFENDKYIEKKEEEKKEEELQSDIINEMKANINEEDFLDLMEEYAVPDLSDNNNNRFKKFNKQKLLKKLDSHFIVWAEDMIKAYKEDDDKEDGDDIFDREKDWVREYMDFDLINETFLELFLNKANKAVL